MADGVGRLLAAVGEAAAVGGAVASGVTAGVALAGWQAASSSKMAMKMASCRFGIEQNISGQIERAHGGAPFGRGIVPKNVKLQKNLDAAMLAGNHALAAQGHIAAAVGAGVAGFHL